MELVEVSVDQPKMCGTDRTGINKLTSILRKRQPQEMLSYKNQAKTHYGMAAQHGRVPALHVVMMYVYTDL